MQIGQIIRKNERTKKNLKYFYKKKIIQKRREKNKKKFPQKKILVIELKKNQQNNKMAFIRIGKDPKK